MLAALAQLSPRPGDLSANARTVVQVLGQHPEADLAVFPELFLTGYSLARTEELAAEVDAPPLRHVADAAARAGTAVVIGFMERWRGGVANSVACFGTDGALAGVYRKTHLFGAESEAFVAGDSLLVVRLAGRSVAPLICFDMEFPETARAVARAGADLLVTASANMAPFEADHRIAAPARAVENRMPHLYVNRCGTEDGLHFLGSSRAIDANGGVTVEAPDDQEQVLTASVGAAGATDKRVDYLAHARGDLPVETPLPTPLSSGGTS